MHHIVFIHSPINGHLGCFYVLAVVINMNIDLPSLHSVLLPKLPSMNLQNALSTILAFYISLLQIKEGTSQKRRCSSGPILMKFVDLAMFPIMPEAAA